MSASRDLVDEVFREESGRILAALIRVTGDFDLAEEAMQDAFAVALERWASDGTPDNPAAWITTAARRKAIDRLRRERVRRGEATSIENRPAPESDPITVLERGLSTLDDDRLRLMFTCCHPALNRDAQIALTLRTLGGLRTEEIAQSFLVPSATLAQRLVRAKQKIKAARIPYRIPPDHLLAERVPSLLAVLYLIFNEGYSASTGDHLIRHEMCAEAMRLARVLTGLMPDEPEALGLLALMCLEDSRRDARCTRDGEIVLLEDQDRSRWDRTAIREGVDLLTSATRLRCSGSFQLQAAIAAEHARAERADATDWGRIVPLYDHLLAIHRSPVVALNRAVAVAMRDGPEVGLRLIDELRGLDEYLYFHAARADLLSRSGRTKEAKRAYEHSLSLARNSAERRFLARRIRE